MRTTLRPTNSQEISVSGTAAENAVNLKSPTLNIYCATECYIKLGADDTVTATASAAGYDKLIPAGTSTDISTGGAPYVSIVLASGSDTAYIHEWTNEVL